MYRAACFSYPIIAVVLGDPALATPRELSEGAGTVTRGDFRGSSEKSKATLDVGKLLHVANEVTRLLGTAQATVQRCGANMERVGLGVQELKTAERGERQPREQLHADKRTTSCLRQRKAVTLMLSSLQSM
jgi:hypothetical protein